jgi:hypothetical protein
MKKFAHIVMNCFLMFGAATLLQSCGTTTDLSGFPPVAISGTIDGKPIRVVYYPDKSKPTEIEYAGGAGPIEINLDK